jgi:hypothetical protein
MLAGRGHYAETVSGPAHHRRTSAACASRVRTSCCRRWPGRSGGGRALRYVFKRCLVPSLRLQYSSASSPGCRHREEQSICPGPSALPSPSDPVACGGRAVAETAVRPRAAAGGGCPPRKGPPETPVWGRCFDSNSADLPAGGVRHCRSRNRGRFVDASQGEGGALSAETLSHPVPESHSDVATPHRTTRLPQPRAGPASLTASVPLLLSPWQTRLDDPFLALTATAHPADAISTRTIPGRHASDPGAD